MKMSIMSNDELDHLLTRAHKDVTLFDYNETKVPCIILEEKRFDNIMKTIAGKPISVETNLNILQDGLGHVFVDVSLNFSQVEMVEKLLLYANDYFEFFEALAESSMLQLPKPERAINALEIIKKGLKK